MGTALPSYVVQRGRVFHFRFCLPKRFWVVMGKRELRSSLGTGYTRFAASRAGKCALAIQMILDAYDSGRLPAVTDEEIRELVRATLRRELEAEHRQAIRYGKDYSYIYFSPIEELGGLDEYQCLKETEYLHASRDFKAMAPAVSDMFKRHGIDVDPKSNDFSMACYEYSKNLVEFFRTLWVRANGDHEAVSESLMDAQELTPQRTEAGNEPSTAAPVGSPLSEVFKRYCVERIKGGEWKPRTQKQNEDNFRWLTDHFGDVPIDSIDGDMMRGLKEMLMKATARNATRNPKPLAPRTIKNIQVACLPSSTTRSRTSTSKRTLPKALLSR